MMPNPYVNNQQTAPYQYVPNIAPSPVNPKRPSSRLRTGSIVVLTLLLVVIFGVGLFAGWQFGRTGTLTGAGGANSGVLQPGTGPVLTVPPFNGTNVDAVRETVVAKVRPAVVQVDVAIQGGRAIGSGVIIDNRGYIVTNNHVIAGALSIEVVLFDGLKVPARLAGNDPLDDLAVLKIAPPTTTLAVATLGDSSKLQVGQGVLAIGNPLGNTQTVTNGIISALGRAVSEGRGGTTIPDAIQTDAPINPGNSGGALVDLQGDLIGIPTLSAIDPEFNTPANGVGFAIPSNRVKLVVFQIIQTGHVTHSGRAALGVSLADVGPILATQDKLSINHGVLIVSIVTNGPAALAGLQHGDVIVQIDNQAVNGIASLGDVLVSKNPGDVVAVHVYRGTQQKTVNVKLGEIAAK